MSYGVEYIFFSVIRGVDPKYKVEGLRGASFSGLGEIMGRGGPVIKNIEDGDVNTRFRMYIMK